MWSGKEEEHHGGGSRTWKDVMVARVGGAQPPLSLKRGTDTNFGNF